MLSIFYISINILGDNLLLWGLVGHLWNSAQSTLIFHQGRQDFFGCSAQCPLDDIFYSGNGKEHYFQPNAKDQNCFRF